MPSQDITNTNVHITVVTPTRAQVIPIPPNAPSRVSVQSRMPGVVRISLTQHPMNQFTAQAFAAIR